MTHSSSPSPESPESVPRRTFLGGASTLAMAGGLVAGYGTFGSLAVRYLYPSGGLRKVWLFVTDLKRVQPGESFTYRAPSGATIAIARKGGAGTAEDFIALSSVCPHLGCQVHYEPQNDRFFCPCHNGVFNKDGVATGGPPGEAKQSLARYPLRLEKGLLFIEVPSQSLASLDTKTQGELFASVESTNDGSMFIIWNSNITDIQGGRAGHDSCLGASPGKCC